MGNLLGALVTLTPHDNFLVRSKLNAFADNKSNVAKMMISVFYTVENIVGKGEKAGYQPFLLFPQCFQEASSSGSLKLRSKELNLLPNDKFLT